MTQPKDITSEYIKVKESSIHHKGIFAAKNIPAGERIIEYVGRLVTKEESDEIADEHLYKSKQYEDHGAVYLFQLDDTYDIDGSVSWNTARYINHSCNPNCEAVNEDGHIQIFALKDIKKGEELHYDYGYDIDNYEEHPCLCGSENCKGYIVAQDQWDELDKKLKDKKKEKLD